MRTVHEWMNSTRAGDIMTRNVACVGVRDRLADAINLFLRERISGAPVVDQVGMCVGVLSATDIVSFEEKRERMPLSGAAHQRSFDSWAWSADWSRQFGKMRNENQSLLEVPVSEYMTRDIVSVTEDTPLGVMLRMMVDSHVHRVLVLDHSRRVRGIVSTMDILAATLRAGRHEPAATAGIPS